MYVSQWVDCVPQPEQQPVQQHVQRPAALRRCAVVSLLALHALLAGWIAAQNSRGIDELAHLTAGISYWHYGTFVMYRVNPPLVKLIAAAPVVLDEPETEWTAQTNALGRPVFASADRFAARNRERLVFYITSARWACIPLSLLGGWVCFRWAREMYGERAAFLALVLWCFCPNILAWTSCVTMDLGAASLGVLAAYAFWRWLKEPGPPRAVIAGVAFGVAQLTKFTWIVLFALWPVIWLLWECSSRHPERTGTRAGRARELAVILLLGLNVLNLGYLFDGSFQPLGDYTFVTRTLAGADSPLERGSGGNRFAGTWIGAIPVPLPGDYVSGIDRQKFDFEQRMWSYLRGEWRHGGWWYYYLYAAAIKVPLGVWMLAALALAATLSTFWMPRHQRLFDSDEATSVGYWAGWRNEATLLMPAFAVFGLVSSQTGFSHHFRYVVPCLPFAFIWISKLARSFELHHWRVTLAAGIALAWAVASSLIVYPHSLSYFNELAGGPAGGHEHLLDSNIDWGQDLRRLARWRDRHPEARPLYLTVRGAVTDAGLAIQGYPVPPTGPTQELRRYNAAELRYLGPHPGWHVLSVERLHRRDGGYDYFLKNFKPVMMVGYSIHIYHLTIDDANRVRRQMGLPQVE